MIKFRIHPKIYEGEKCRFAKVLKNVKIIGLHHHCVVLNLSIKLAKDNLHH